jgi:putative transposase
MIKDLPLLYIEYPFLKEVDSMSLRCSLFDLDNAYISMFKEKTGYPKFKGKYTSKNTYRTNYITSTYCGKKYENIKLDLKNKTITLPKLKKVMIRGYRNLVNIEGKIINATIEHDKTNKYYVKVLYEQDIIVPSFIPNKIIGIDLGVKNIITTSDNEKIVNEKLINKYEKRIKRKQRELSRKIKGSNNYYKIKKELAIIYKKLVNARKHLIHNITNKLVKENDIIVSETLKVKEMLQEKKISKQISNVSFNEICRMIEYKSKLLGKKYIKIDTYYPSSQECNVCGEINKETKNLQIRKWICKNCNNKHDRDLNASINIMYEGLKIYMKELI